jgi:hypothetical protein
MSGRARQFHSFQTAAEWQGGQEETGQQSQRQEEGNEESRSPHANGQDCQSANEDGQEEESRCRPKLANKEDQRPLYQEDKENSEKVNRGEIEAQDGIEENNQRESAEGRAAQG